MQADGAAGIFGEARAWCRRAICAVILWISPILVEFRLHFLEA